MKDKRNFVTPPAEITPERARGWYREGTARDTKKKRKVSRRGVI